MAVAQTAPHEKIVANIRGNVSGMVAVGKYIFQISIHGGLVNIALPGRQARLRPRAIPVFLRPPSSPDLLDRKAEVEVVTTAFAPDRPVEFFGQEGIGKTTLLHNLAHHPFVSHFPAGVVYLWARRKSVDDLLQSLFDAFYESNLRFKPTDVQIRNGLQDKQALILLDDVDLSWDEVEALMNAAPSCTFLLASPDRHLWGRGRVMALHGLPLDQALALVERELDRLGQPLTPGERPAAQALCITLDGHPLRLIQAVALAREEGYSLAEVSGEALAERVLASRSEPERRTLAALAVLGGGPLSSKHLAPLTGLSDTTSILETLLRHGLVKAEGSHYSLIGDLAQTLRRVQNLTSWAERALTYFTTWAEQYRQNPDQLLEDADAILQVLEWAVKTGRWQEVLRLTWVVEGALALNGQWGAWGQVLRWGLQAAQATRNRAGEAWAWHQLGTRALCLEDTVTARTSLVKALRLRETLGDQVGAAITRNNLNFLPGPPPSFRRSTRPTTQPSPPPGVREIVATLPLPLKGMIAILPVLVVLGGLIGRVPAPPAFPTPSPPPATVFVSPTLISIVTPMPSPTLPPTNTPTVAPTPTVTPILTPTPTMTPIPTPTSTLTPDPGPPAPQLLAPAQGAQISCTARETAKRVQLQWSPVSDSSGIQMYEVHLQATQRSPHTYPAQSYSQPFADILLPCGEAYLWQVRAIDGAGNPGAWSEVRVFLVIDTTPPPAPTLLSPKEEAEIRCPTGEPIEVVLRWSPVTDPAGIARYDVELVKTPEDMPGTPPPPSTALVPIAGSQSQAAVSSECGASYRWQVRAVDGVGNAGEWSAPRIFRIPATPTPMPDPPDLVVTTLQTTGPLSISGGAEAFVEVPIRVVVKNQGGVAADIFKVSIEYTGPNGTFVVPFTVPGQGNIRYPYTSAPLVAGSEVMFEGKVIFPLSAGLRGQTVSIKATADSCSGDELMPGYCRVEESNEGNNESTPISVSLPAQPDLVVYKLSGPQSAQPGQDIGDQMRLIVSNQGDAEAVDFFVDIVISLDTNIDTSDQLLIGGRDYVPKVAAGRQAVVNLTGQGIPKDWPSGNSYVGVILDSFNSQPESDEQNNTGFLPILVSPPSPLPPAAPSNLSYDRVGCSTIVIIWQDNADNEDEYRVYRNGSLMDTLKPDTTSFTDEGASTAEYRYGVAAFNAGGQSATTTITVPQTIC